VKQITTEHVKRFVSQTIGVFASIKNKTNVGFHAFIVGEGDDATE